MIFFKVKDDWNKQSNALKAKYPKLTSEDVKFETGKETDLFRRMESRLDKNRGEVVNILKTNQKACCLDKANWLELR
jgi:hypothetical protein